MRTCAKCGTSLPIETGRGARRKMCAKCSPSRPRRKPQPPAAAVAVAASPIGCVADATRAVLAAERMLDAPMGRAAMVLAERIDDRDQPLAAVSQAVKQLREALAAVLTTERAVPADPNDEFTRMRLARESGR